MKGRPLRFLAVVLGGWIALRAALLWPVQTLPTAAPAHGPLVVTNNPLDWPAPGPPVLPRWSPEPWPRAAVAQSHAAGRAGKRAEEYRLHQAFSLLALTRFGPTMLVSASREEDRDASDEPAASPGAQPPDGRQPGALPAPIAALALPPGGQSRWRGAFWLVGREGAGLARAVGGQLGGSQLGGRIGYALDARARVAVVGRIATPLGARGAEAALGVEWQPTRLPVRLVAEQRFAIDGAGGGPTLGVVGGFGPTPLAGLRLQGYGQAGFIARGQGVGYADGALRLDRALYSTRGTQLSLGAGAWGAAQPGARRLDLGPLLGVDVPAGRDHLRLSVEWRARVAGGASPGSGPALSLGADF